MENTLAFIQTCLSRFVKFGSRVVEGGALAALRAMDTMIEHFEYMGFANTAHIGPLNQARHELADFLTFADYLLGQATETLNNWVQWSG